MYVCVGGPKSRLAKAAGAGPAGQMRNEKLHGVVARSTFRSQNVQNTPVSDHFWKLRCRKSARRCGAKHISKSKCTKHIMLRPLLEVEMSKKCTPLWREAHFEVKMHKTHQCRTTFGSWDVEKVHAVVVRSTFRSQNVQNTHMLGPLLEVQMSKTRGRRKGMAPKSGQNVILQSMSKAMAEKWGRRGYKRHFPWRRLQMLMEVRRSGRWFPERGCILEHQIFRFAEMTLRDRCSTSYDLASLFRGRRSTLDRWSGKIAKRIGTRPSALHSTFHFWRKSRRIASFLMLWTSKKRKPFVFDVVKFKNWGSLAELLRFWRCQVQKLRKSRRIAALQDRQIDW